MKNIFTALRLFLFLTLIIGVAYPLVVTFYANTFVSEKSKGSLVSRDQKTVASSLIAQKFQSEKYFWPRPSSVEYNAASSGASNLGLTSNDLLSQYNERQRQILTANATPPTSGHVPQDLLFASGSGLDPHISPEAALFQVERVAKTRGIDSNQVRNFVNQLTESRQFGILGEPRVNVVLLNLAIDHELHQ